MKYSVDRIEENIAVLQDLETKELKEVDLSKIPMNLKEGDILEEVDGNLIKRDDIKNNRKIALRQKLERLKRKKDDFNN